MNWETLLCLGDSITFGARSYLGYPEMCGEILSKRLKKDWNIINHSTSGFTTIDLLRSISPRVESYKSEFPNLITIMIGTNDIKNNVSLENFQIAYRQLIVKSLLMSTNDNVVLLKIPHFTKDVFYPYVFEMNKKVEEFNKEIEGLAANYKLRTLTLKLRDSDFFDGVHFNEEGSASAADQLANFILSDKGFESSTDLS